MKHHLEASAGPGYQATMGGAVCCAEGHLGAGTEYSLGCAPQDKRPPSPGKQRGEAGSGWVWEWNQGRLRHDCFCGAFSCLFFVIAIGSQDLGRAVGQCGETSQLSHSKGLDTEPSAVPSNPQQSQDPRTPPTRLRWVVGQARGRGGVRAEERRAASLSLERRTLGPALTEDDFCPGAGLLPRRRREGADLLGALSHSSQGISWSSGPLALGEQSAPRDSVFSPFADRRPRDTGTTLQKGSCVQP